MLNKSAPIESARIILGPGASAAPERSIGAMLMDAGKITPEDGERILRHARETGKRFGDAAVALKLVAQADIEHILAHQFDYRYLRTGQSAISEEVVAAWSPFSGPVEALRALRTQLMLRWFGAGERKSLVITSPGRAEGRSHLAANLAVVFSQMGGRTLLVDADLRNPRQHALFGLPNTAGLSTVLAERSDLSVIQRIHAFLDLSLLTAGALPPNPLELLSRGSFTTLIDQVSASYDFIIVDTPAARLGSDSQIVGVRCGGALLVARKNRTSLDDCQDLAEAIKASGAELVGAVMNDI